MVLVDFAGVANSGKVGTEHERCKAIEGGLVP